MRSRFVARTSWLQVALLAATGPNASSRLGHMQSGVDYQQRARYVPFSNHGRTRLV
jgi:hypothetical protein